MYDNERCSIIRHKKERGVLAPSYYAHIIAIKNNPLEDIVGIKTIQFVMKEGKVIRRD